MKSQGARFGKTKKSSTQIKRKTIIRNYPLRATKWYGQEVSYIA